MVQTTNTPEDRQPIHLTKSDRALMRRSLFVFQQQIKENPDRKHTVTVEDLNRLNNLLADPASTDDI